MKSEELKNALRLINKVSFDSRMGSDQRDQLQRARRDLMKLASSNKVERQKVFRIVETIARVLQESVEHQTI